MPSFNFSLNRRGQKYSRLSQGQEVINENDRTHWSTRSAVIRHLRKLAKQAGQNYINAQLRNKEPHTPLTKTILVKSLLPFHPHPNAVKMALTFIQPPNPLLTVWLTQDFLSMIMMTLFVNTPLSLATKTLKLKSLNGDRIERYIITITLNPL